MEASNRLSWDSSFASLEAKAGSARSPEASGRCFSSLSCQAAGPILVGSGPSSRRSSRGGRGGSGGRACWGGRACCGGRAACGGRSRRGGGVRCSPRGCPRCLPKAARGCRPSRRCGGLCLAAIAAATCASLGCGSSIISSVASAVGCSGAAGALCCGGVVVRRASAASRRLAKIFVAFGSLRPKLPAATIHVRVGRCAAGTTALKGAVSKASQPALFCRLQLSFSAAE